MRNIFYTLFAAIVVMYVGVGYAAAEGPFPSCNASWNNRLLQTQPSDRIDPWENAGRVIERAPCPTVDDTSQPGWVSERYFISRENGRFYTDCRERSRPELGWECRRVWRPAAHAAVETEHDPAYAVPAAPLPRLRPEHPVQTTYQQPPVQAADAANQVVNLFAQVLADLRQHQQPVAPMTIVVPAMPPGYMPATCVVGGQPVVCYVPTMTTADPVH